MTRRFRRSPHPLATVVVFAREPIAGRTKTRLIPRLGAHGAAALADAFLLDALVKARSTRRRVVIAGDAPAGVAQSVYFRRLARRFGAVLIDQGQGPLGARMQRALTPFCASGAILIGADIPSLPSSILERGLTLLRHWPVVIAPTIDGGYCMLGVRGELPDIFRGVRWGSTHVLAETTLRLRQSRTEYALADGWYDIDCWSDVLALAAELRLMPVTEEHPCPVTARILARLGLL